MIDYFKSWIYMLIGISSLALLIELVLPNEKFKKYVYMIVGLLTTLVLASPIVNILDNDKISEVAKETVSKLDKESSYSKADVEEIMKSKNKLVLKSVVKKIQNDIIVKTNMYGMTAKNVTVTIDDKYEIEEIIIETADKMQIERIKAVIKYIADIYEIKENKITVNCVVE